MWFVLIVIGTFMRGPELGVFWPWESWEVTQQNPPPRTWNLIMVDLSDCPEVFSRARKCRDSVAGPLGVLTAFGRRRGAFWRLFRRGDCCSRNW
jgi:hypothetical protein